MQAGRIMLTRLKELGLQRESFAFETTLASRTFAPWILQLKSAGYEFHLIYLWLPSDQMAISRVESRVRLKGHHVPDDIVQRRYRRGLENFFRIYQPIATMWKMYYNGEPTGPQLVAQGNESVGEQIVIPDMWNHIKAEANHA